MNSPNYYKTNALYNHLDANPNTNFYFTSGNMWQVIYGDAHAVPRLLLLITGVPAAHLQAQPTDKEVQAKELLGWLSRKTHLPLIHIRFADDAMPTPENHNAGLDSVTIVRYSDAFEEVSLLHLADIYREYGLPVPAKAQATVKPVNDAESSAYHKWQRSALGPITVSDIDLWAIDNSRTPKRIFELKRSFQSFKDWKPYPADYTNFKLLYNAFTPASLKVFIAYNVRKTKPWNDDISQLKVYLLDFTPGKNPPYDEVSLPYTLDKFLSQ